MDEPEFEQDERPTLYISGDTKQVYQFFMNLVERTKVLSVFQTVNITIWDDALIEDDPDGKE